MHTKTHLSLFFQFCSILCVCFVTATAQASTPQKRTLLQFEAAGHILGFEKDKVYVASANHMLKIEFIGTEGVDPTGSQMGNKDVTKEPKAQLLREVSYNNLWPDIDLSYRASTAGITESIWTIKPGGSPDKIRMQYNAPVEIAKDGSLRTNYQSGWMSESHPVAWQFIDGQRMPVEVQFKKIAKTNSNAHIGFEVGQYNQRFPLSIDPIMQWNTFLGGSLWESTSSMKVDSGGNVYVVGYGYSNWGTPVNAHSGYYNRDGLVVKLNGAGSVVWNSFFGANGGANDNYDVIAGIDIDNSGNVYLVGSSSNTWGTPLNAHSGNYDAFIIKLNSSGIYQWHTFQGSANQDYAYGVAVDSSGNIYASGQSNGTWSSPISAHAGGYDAFLMKLDNNGTPQWHTFLGSSGNDLSYRLAIDSSDNVLLAGYGNAAWGSPVNPYSGATDAFVAKVDSTGTLQWHSFFGSTGDDYGIQVAIDSSGNIVLGGYGSATWGAPINPFAGGTDAFVVLLNDTGNLQWHTFLGSANDDNGGYIDVDASGYIYISGVAKGSWGAPIGAHSGNDDSDAFAAQLDSSGTLQWHTFMGGVRSSPYYDNGIGIGVDCAGNVFVAGTTDGLSWGSPLAPYHGASDMFVQRIGNPGHAVCTSAPSDEGSFTPSFRLVSDSNTTTFDVNSESGYIIDTVTGCGGTWSGVNPYTTDTITGNCKVEASFTPNIFYTVNATVDSNGSLDVASASVNQNSTASFTITPDPGFTPSTAVTGDCPAGTWSNNTYTIGAITAGCTVNFTTSPAVTVTPSTGPNGTISPDTAQIVAVDSTPQFTLTPDTDYAASVGGTCGGTLVGNIFTTNAVTADCTVEATFVQIHTVNAFVDAHGTLDVDSAEIPDGMTASFTVTPEFGYITDLTVGGTCLAGSWNGATYTTGAITDTCSLNFTNSTVGMFTVTPTPVSPASLLSAGEYHSLALKGDGMVMAWGYNGDGQTTIPGTLSTVKAVAAGGYFSLALQTDGTVAAWGSNSAGQTTIPTGLSTVTAIASGHEHSLALKADGTVVAWGRNSEGQTTVPTGLSDVVAIACGVNHSLALLGNGIVVGWGHNFSGQATPPVGLTNVTAISAGRLHSLALKSDGTLVAWGDNASGQITIPEGLVDVMAVAAGREHSLAVKSDGTVLAWGANTGGQTNVPAGLNAALAVAGGRYHSLSLKSDGTIVAWGDTSYGQTTIPGSLNLLPFAGSDGTVLPNVHQSVIDGETTSFTMIPKAGYSAFVGGSCGGTLIGNTYTTSAIISDCTVDTTFALSVNHTVSAQVDENGSLDASSTVVVEGSSANFIVTPANGYTTDSAVTGDCPAGSWTEQTYTTGAIIGSCNVHFTNTVNTYTVNASVDDKGLLNASSAEVDYGSEANFTVTANDHYSTNTVVGGDCPSGSWIGSSYTTGAITKSCSVIFNHTIDNFTVNATVDSYGTLDPSTETVEYGSTAAFSVTPATGYTTDSLVTGDCPVGSWSGSTYTTGVITVGCGLGFTHTANSYTVSAEVDNHGSLDITSTVVNHGSTASFTVTPESGYQTNTIAGGECPAGSWSGTTYTTEAIVDACTLIFTHSPVTYTVTPVAGDPATLISAGRFHALALKSDGTVVAWGNNYYGQSNVPQGLINVIAVSAGQNHSLALKNDGTVIAWGDNRVGQTNVPASLQGVIAISAGSDHSLALKLDGTIVAWGANTWGESNVPSGLFDVVAIAGGGIHSLALKRDGSVVAWGHDQPGTVPEGLTEVVAISAGYQHSLALKLDGTIVAWGDNRYGQTNVPSGLSDVVSIASRFQHSLAIKSDGEVVGWGSNDYGESTTSGLTDVVTVSGGGFFSIALKSDGNVLAWGTDSSGWGVTNVPASLNLLPFQSSNGVISANMPQLVSTGSTIQFSVTPDTNYTASVGGTCGGTLDGDTYTTDAINASCTVVATFILNTYKVSASIDANGALNSRETTANHGATVSFTAASHLGYAADTTVSGDCSSGTWNGSIYTTGVIDGTCAVSFSNTLTHFKISPSPGSAAPLISGGGFHSLALNGDGTVIAWGREFNDATNVPPGLTDAVAVAAGYTHSIALKRDGTVVGWGNIEDPPTGLTDVVAIAAGNSHAVALKSDGTVVSWGSNYYGETDTTALADVVAISAAWTQTFALKSNGTVVGLGSNNVGQTAVPPTLTDAIAIAAGTYHTLALKSDGTVVGWGLDSDGHSSPPPELSDVIAISAGERFSIALKSDGTVVGWGRDSTSAKNTEGLTNVVAISAGHYHTLALKSDGTVIALGVDSSGQSTVPNPLNLLPFKGVHGIISPDILQLIPSDSTAQFTVMPNEGYTVFMGGTCGGTLVNNSYTTNSITTDCTVEATFAPIPGDINQDGFVDLADTILALQIITGTATSYTVTDVNGDGKIGLAEALYSLQKSGQL